MANLDRWCFAWIALDPLEYRGKTRAALLKGARWNHGAEITVSFLDGDPKLHARVKEVAKRWVKPGPANLTLAFVADPREAFIRISFHYAGSWSVLGTTCKRHMQPDQPTMNFGWLTPDSTNDAVQRVVLHEFGHALGLVHEHQNPAGTIGWNRTQVIADLSGPPNRWTLDQIERNMFKPYKKMETNFTELDPTSIMVYPIPARWTKDGFSTGLNLALSPLDKKLIAAQYP